MQKFLEVNTLGNIKDVEVLAKEIWSQHYKNLLSVGQINYMLEKFQSYDAIMDSIKSGEYTYFLTQDDAIKNRKNFEYDGYFAIRLEQKELFLSKLYLGEWARGRGLGRGIINKITELAKENKKEKIYLTVNRQNSTVEIYKKMGFTIRDSIVMDIGNGYVMDDYIMEKAVM